MQRLNWKYLQQGCLNPIKVVIPQNTLLNPPEHVAVVGGNVLTSQRVTDVVLKAFRVCAASQGCMNNLTYVKLLPGSLWCVFVTFFLFFKWVQVLEITVLGNEKCLSIQHFDNASPCFPSYYETIAGGAGAGPTWQGQSGVHTHMTNVRLFFMNHLFLFPTIFYSLCRPE